MLRECRGKWKFFIWLPINLGMAPGVAVLCIAQIVRCHSESGISIPRITVRIPRAALRNSENIRSFPRAPRTAFSLQERFSWNWGGPQLPMKDIDLVLAFWNLLDNVLWCFSKNFFLRIRNGVGKQGYGNRSPIDDRNPIRKFSINCLDASKTND